MPRGKAKVLLLSYEWGPPDLFQFILQSSVNNLGACFSCNGSVFGCGISFSDPSASPLIVLTSRGGSDIFHFVVYITCRFIFTNRKTFLQ